MNPVIQTVEAITFLSEREILTLRSTLISEYDDRFNCRSCVQMIRSRAKDEAQVKRALWQKGCAESVPHIVYQDEVFQYHTCPRMHHSNQVREFINAESLTERGLLPFSGGIFDQPAKMMEVFSVIKSFKTAKLREEEAKKSARVKNQGRVKRG